MYRARRSRAAAEAGSSAETRGRRPTDSALLRLQAAAGNRAVARLVAGQRQLQREGLIDSGIEWIKEKFHKETEKDLDEQLVDGMSRTARVLSLAAAAERDVEKAEAYAKAAEQFKGGAESGEKIVNAKEYVELVIEFIKALKEAKDVDLSRDGPEGAAKLFKLMAAGGKIGEKVFPPPFNSYFKFLAQMHSLENVGRVYGGDPLDQPDERDQARQIDWNP
jgi:hypothetical protein